MRLIYALGILCGLVVPAAAANDAWTIREGMCNDWVGTWRVSETSPGVFVGEIEQYQIKEPCVNAKELGHLTENVSATIVSCVFKADKTGATANDNCHYDGTLTGKKITGKYQCPNHGSEWFSFVIDQ
jgi:hypothetical protein